MGLLLQEFYRNCSFLHLGFGMAGEAFASGKYRWASGEELLVQISFLSGQNHQPAPVELQALPLIKTVVCIPLQNGAGVLEIGTKDLVRESEVTISDILRFIGAGPAITQGTSWGKQIMSLSIEAGTEVLPNVGKQYEDPYEQYKSASIMETYGDRANFRRPSNASSYWSPSSTSSSTPSAGDQKGNSSFVLNTMDNEDSWLISPATPKPMVNSIDEVNILKQLDHMDMQDVTTPISLQDLDSYPLNNADIIAHSQFSHDHHLNLSDLPLYFSSADVAASSPLLCPMDDSRYAYSHRQGNTENSYLLDNHVLQPVECAYTVSNEQVDVGEPSKEPNIECQTSSCNQPQIASISCLPSETFQTSSHSAPYSNDQWRYMFPGVNEGDGMTDLLGQSERNTHAMVSAGISKIPLAEYLLEANIDRNITPDQGAALMIENEGSTIKNRSILIMGMSSTNAIAYEAFMDRKMCRQQGEKIVVPSTVPIFATQAAAGSHASYASGSAEAEKEAATGSYGIYASGLAEDYKVDASLQAEGSYVSYPSEAYRVVGTSASQAGAGSYVSYPSGSAEAEKVVGSSAAILSTHGPGRGAGDQYGRVLQGTELLGVQKLHGVQDGPYIASSFTNIGTPHDSSANFTQHDTKTEHHKFAERDRRRKHGDCINTLRALLPNITKKDPKTTILESTIQYVKELTYRMGELEQENAALMNLKSKDQKKSAKHSSHHVSKSKNATNMKSSKENIGSQENATCQYILSSSVQMPYFQLILIKNVQDVKANATIIEILNSLQNKNLWCYEINYEFCKNNNKLFVNISANYKDGGNCSPTSDEIKGIKEWWEHSSFNF